ncbi:MAG: uroporphyrinogen-III synthase [Litorilituus sp.]|nr:uroporphyrinogen-III synthase [Litorilituus sp.]
MHKPMLTTNNVNKLNVLITRPEKKAQQLALSLQQQGILCVNQPLFDYHPLANANQCKSVLTQVDIVIFVSVAAVEFANKVLSAGNWQYQHIFAVGRATQKALEQLGIKKVHVPRQESSEGLLALPLLNDKLSQQQVTIVRGNGGREHLADTITSRGASVNYLESYQRVWRTLPKDISKQWYEQEINCIVITSNAILTKLAEILAIFDPSSTDTATLHWLNNCTWLVVSTRIAKTAKRLGFKHVFTSSGASDEQICLALTTLSSNN